jgi:hypothetical protein
LIRKPAKNWKTPVRPANRVNAAIVVIVVIAVPVVIVAAVMVGVMAAVAVIVARAANALKVARAVTRTMFRIF